MNPKEARSIIAETLKFGYWYDDEIDRPAPKGYRPVPMGIEMNHEMQRHSFGIWRQRQNGGTDDDSVYAVHGVNQETGESFWCTDESIWCTDDIGERLPDEAA